MTDRADIQARAKRRLAALARAWRDPRYKHVIGRLAAAKLLETNMDVEPNREPMHVEDALWVGRFEPRVLELLPALIVKRPSLFADLTGLPDDLEAVVRALRRNEEPPAFRGVAGADVQRWLPSVGHRGKLPSRLKSFRLQHADTALLTQLSERLGVNETEVLRRALRSLAASQLAG